MNEQVDRLAALYSRSESVRIPPQSVEAEQAVLGALMIREGAWPLVSDMLDESDFYRREHQLIWRAIKELAERRQPFDALTVGDWFDSNGLAEHVENGAYVTEIASTTPSAANVRAYSEIVRDKSVLRKLIEAGTTITNDAFQPEGRTSDDILNSATQALSGIHRAQSGGLELASDEIAGWYAEFCEQYENGTEMTGMPTPWHDFNEVTHGLQPSTLYLIAARPSMGKSVFGLNLSLFSALRGVTTGLFSLEMSKRDCLHRNLASLARIPHSWVIAPTHAGDDDCTIRMTPALRQLREAKLYIDDTASINVRQFEARARRMHMRTPLQLLVVDHIHDFDIDAKQARFEYGRIVQVAKNLAKEWKIPVVLLAQLNRNVAGRADKRPTLTDLRESGELEQKADVIAFLHREDYYDTPDSRTHLQGVVELHIAKGRNIRAGERINLKNRFDQMRLEDWEGDLPYAPKLEKPERRFGRKHD